MPRQGLSDDGGNDDVPDDLMRLEADALDPEDLRAGNLVDRRPDQVGSVAGLGDDQREQHRREPRWGADPEDVPIRELDSGEKGGKAVKNETIARLPGGLSEQIAAATCGSGSGQGAGCMLMTYPILRPGRGEGTTAGQIMANITAGTEHADQCVAN